MGQLKVRGVSTLCMATLEIGIKVIIRAHANTCTHNPPPPTWNSWIWALASASSMATLVPASCRTMASPPCPFSGKPSLAASWPWDTPSPLLSVLEYWTCACRRRSQGTKVAGPEAHPAHSYLCWSVLDLCGRQTDERTRGCGVEACQNDGLPGHTPACEASANGHILTIKPRLLVASQAESRNGAEGDPRHFNKHLFLHNRAGNGIEGDPRHGS
eukprot:1156162-Pelagomonas_calceolata.AAC.4